MPDNEINVVITATDKTANIIAGVAKSLTGISQTIGKVTGGYIAYGDEVRRLSDFVGTNSVATSRMIQLADDAFVSFETLRMASKNLSEKGMQPTVENMAKLSDEFLKLNPGLDRSQFLVDKFGRAGIEMAAIMKLGSEKIIQMNAAIEKGLIIDDEKAARILRTKQALDGFNDSMDSMKFQVADKLLSIFEGMPEPMKNIVLVMGAAGQSGVLNSLAQMAIIGSNIGKLNLGATLTGIGTGMRAMGTGAVAALGPLLPLVAAITGLVMLLNSSFGQRGLTALKQLLAMEAGGIGGLFGGVQGAQNAFMNASNSMGLLPGRANGGSVLAGHSYMVGERGIEKFTPSQNGSIIPNHALGGVNLTVVYSPAVSTASRMEIDTILKPIIVQALRQAPGR